MREFTFWYKTKVKAPTLQKAMLIEAKKKPILSSVEHKDDEERELTSAIGFCVDTESDFEDE